jgi:hypothetical protein
MIIKCVHVCVYSTWDVSSDLDLFFLHHHYIYIYLSFIHLSLFQMKSFHQQSSSDSSGLVARCVLPSLSLPPSLSSFFSSFLPSFLPFCIPLHYLVWFLALTHSPTHSLTTHSSNRQQKLHTMTSEMCVDPDEFDIYEFRYSSEPQELAFCCKEVR